MTDTSKPSRKRGLWIATMWFTAILASWLVMRRAETPTQAKIDVYVPAESSAMKPLGALDPSPPMQFRGDRRHTGRSAYVGPARSAIRWKYALDARVTADPVVDADGNLYVGTHAGTLWAFNSEGIPLWQRDLGARIYAAALIDRQGTVFVGTDGRGFFGLDPKGEVRFSIATRDDADTPASVAHDGTLRFAAGRTLYSIAAKGTVLWTFDAGGKLFTSVTLDDEGSAFFGAQDDHVYGVDAKGKLLFRYRTSADVDVTPVLADDGTLYVASDDQHVYCLARDGTLVWATRLEGHVRGALALGADNTLLATHSGPRGALVALDRATGEKRFRFAFGLTDHVDSGVRGGPLVDAEGAIYVGADDDYLHALTKQGKLRWALSVGSDLEASPILSADGTLYVVSIEGVLFAVGGNE